MQFNPHPLEGASPTVTMSMLNGPAVVEGQLPFHQPPERPEADSLYTATLHLPFDDYSISMFHACRAASRSEVMARVAIRMASHLLAYVIIREGIDLDHPVVARLVPREIARRLAEFGDCSRSHGPLKQGRDLHIQERSGQ